MFPDNMCMQIVLYITKDLGVVNGSNQQVG